MEPLSPERSRLVTAHRGLFRYYNLSLKIAIFSGALSFITISVVMLVTGWWQISSAAILVAIMTAVTYLSANYFLYERIELARSTLRRTRKYKFRKLDEANFPKGDELNELIRQVYRTGQVLEREIRRLRRVANYRRAYIGDISHELKTPIFAILGYSETLLQGALDDDRVKRTFVQKIFRNAQRLNNLTADLTEISRIETGELQMTFKPFELQSLVSEIMESLEPQAEKQRIALYADIPDDLPRVSGDEQRIRQVLVNLLDNGIKYTDPGGEVRIGMSLEGDDTVNVTVSDTGIGIPKKYIARITERFFRVDKSRSRGMGGTGLGLAIVKHILAAHHQKLQVTSAPDEGSAFRFSLSVAGEASPEDRASGPAVTKETL